LKFKPTDTRLKPTPYRLAKLDAELLLTSYGIIILPVVLYGCETWFLTLREKHSLKVFENGVLGPKIDEVKGE
jgi:hypothetical protein